MPNEKKHIVKYNNDLHQLNLSNLSETQQNIFFTLCEQLQNANGNRIELDLYELYNLAQIPNGSDFRSQNLKKLKVLQTFTFMYDPDENNTVQVVIFPRLQIDTERKLLIAEVAQDFKERYLLSGLHGWTKYELAEFVFLPGKYTKTIYRFLKQWRTQGKWEISYAKFKDILGIPDTYKSCEIDTRIIKPALKALSEPLNLFEEERIPFENLKCEKTKSGVRIKELVFTFKPQSNKEPQKQVTAPQETQQKAQNEVLNKMANVAQTKILKGSETTLNTFLKQFIGQGFWGGKGNNVWCKIENITITENPSNPQENYTIHAKNVETGKTFELKMGGYEHIKNTLNPYYD